ncbi:MAG: sodium:solute symporter [Candidatus Xenobia bacterium]
MSLSPLDLVLLVMYFVAVAAIGWAARARETTTRGYLLGDRGMPWWAVLLSIVGTEISALTFVGVPALAFRGNWTYLQLALGTIMARVIVSRWFVPAYYKSEVTSIYEFLGRRFGPVTRAAGVLVFIVSRVLMSGVRLCAGALIIQTAFGISGTAAIVVVGVLATLYTVAGGIKAVIWTEVLQVAVMFGGALAAIGVLVRGIPGGLPGAIAIAGASKLQLLDWRPSPALEFTMWSALIGCTISNTAIFGTDYDMVQRMLTAPDSKRSMRAVIGSGLADIPIAGMFLGIGTLLFAWYHVHPDPALPRNADEIFPHFILHALPPGLAGLVVAGVLSVVLSSFESALNALAGSFVVDIYRPWLARGKSEAHYVLVTRLATVGFCLALIGVAVPSQGVKGLLEFGLEVGTYTYGALLAVFALGLFTRRRLPDLTAAAGVPCAVVAVLLVKHFTDLAFPWFVTIGALVGIAVPLLIGWRPRAN